MTSRPEVILFTAACSARWRSAAVEGGARGEITMADSLIAGLRALGTAFLACGNLRVFAPHWLRHGWLARAGRQPLLIVDPATLELAVRYRLVAERHAPRLWVLDWFGRSSNDGRPGFPQLPIERTLTPYPYGNGNSFLGFVLNAAEGRPVPNTDAMRVRLGEGRAAKKVQGVLWGKEARYFGGDVRGLVEEIARLVPLHATVSESRGGAPGLFATGVTNHGCLAPAAWSRLLAESSFVLGVGDPLLGPTALEALLAGCTYIDPVYPEARRAHSGSPVFASQHPYAAAIGQPFVRSVSLRDTGAVIAAVRDALAAAATPPGSDESLEACLGEFTAEAFQARLADFLERAYRPAKMDPRS